MAAVVLLVGCTRLTDVFIPSSCPDVVTYACEDKNSSNCRNFSTGCLPSGWSSPGSVSELDKERCETTEYGWYCSLLSKNNHKLNTLTRKEATVLEQPLKELCEKQKGIFMCAGRCMPDYPRSCIMTLSDAGKKCTDSNQCMGSCVTEDYNCKINCEGKCSNIKLGFCDTRLELYSSIPKKIEGAICD